MTALNQFPQSIVTTRSLVRKNPNMPRIFRNKAEIKSFFDSHVRVRKSLGYHDLSPTMLSGIHCGVGEFRYNFRPFLNRYLVERNNGVVAVYAMDKKQVRIALRLPANHKVFLFPTK